MNQPCMFERRLPVVLVHCQVQDLPPVDPAAQRELRTKKKAEIAAAKGKGKKKGKGGKGKGKGKGRGRGKGKAQSKAKGGIKRQQHLNEDDENDEAHPDARSSSEPSPRQCKTSSKRKAPLDKLATPQKTKSKKAQDSPGSTKTKKKQLGCPTCRWARKGCHICRRPGYKPRKPRPADV